MRARTPNPRRPPACNPACSASSNPATAPGASLWVRISTAGSARSGCGAPIRTRRWIDSVIAGSSPAMTGSIHLLVRIGSPQPVLADPAVEILTHKLAPGAVAGFELAEHAGLQAGGLRGFGSRALIKRHQIVLQGRHHHRGALAGQQRVVDPAFCPLPVADAPPVLELGGDLHRHAGAGIDPAHLLVLVRAGAHINPI